MYKATIKEYQDRFKAILYVRKSFLGFKYWSFVDDWHGQMDLIHSVVMFWQERYGKDLIINDRT